MQNCSEFGVAGRRGSYARTLTKQMACLTRTIRCATEAALTQEAFNANADMGMLQQLKQDFNQLLWLSVDDREFADVYAQTIAYGLFALRVSFNQKSDAPPFNRSTIGHYIPTTTAVLKRLFESLVEPNAVGPIVEAVDDLVKFLAQIDPMALLSDFELSKHPVDPVVHFYETFLAEYDRSQRKRRGVYYTPDPVVSFIVRSIDTILKIHFELPLGLADTVTGGLAQTSRVQILDPATGTGIFLHRIVQQIYQNLAAMDLTYLWDRYVEENLLPRLFGFEFLIPPYMITQLKLVQTFQNLGYRVSDKQGLGIYLTRSLDEVVGTANRLFACLVAETRHRAETLRENTPIMVIIGNPPYAGNSKNRGKNIETLMKRYKNLVRSEKNIKPLNDDYIKFICFAHHKIEQIGYGAIGFVTNHSYLNGLIHRGMREELLRTFNEIYILDLHGNSLIKEMTPDGRRDRNIFDIKQGVAILLAIKHKLCPKREEFARVFHHELWGDRDQKYCFLTDCDFGSVPWKELDLRAPAYFFTPQSGQLLEEYNRAWKLTDIFLFQSMGTTSGNDAFLYGFSSSELTTKIDAVLQADLAESGSKMGKTVAKLKQWYAQMGEHNYQKCLYRPFDCRSILYHPQILDRARPKLWQQFQMRNLGLITLRRTRDGIDSAFFVTELIADKSVISSLDNANIFPLYTYLERSAPQGSLLCDPILNLSSDFLFATHQTLGYLPSPEAIFAYLYAIFHCPTYRQRYAEFFKTDFPRLPLIRDRALFAALVEKGQILVDLHCLRSPQLNRRMTTYQSSGTDAVTLVSYEPEQQRIYINDTQYFEGISPALWQYKIGGYPVLKKWLQDRRKARRHLSVEDILHYQRTIVALQETLQVMAEIDRLIPHWPIA